MEVSTMLYLSHELHLGMICAFPAQFRIELIEPVKARRMLDAGFETLVSNVNDAALLSGVVSRPIRAVPYEKSKLALVPGDEMIVVDFNPYVHRTFENAIWYHVKVEDAYKEKSHG
jgi:hypothetical protein